ncbi:shikimate kinase [Acidovorax carolinensis]|uniref:Shikimate kinase n=1 Tax=Acidovorax carolinensis TaxID=553814 RepID=A0A240TZB5_9BURK|nr:shikimate kinase [Acidovorax carolinensis]ART50487.1 shikimate kinase [Acidovorax carolinensis]
MQIRCALVGMPGSGKSTVGRQLAHRAGVPFIDLDHRLEKMIGTTIRSFFETQGEARFRDLEAQVLAEVTQQPGGMVLSTGGGAVLRAENREVLRQFGNVLYLRASPEEIYKRVKHDKTRPLLQGGNPMEKLRELYAVRDPLYRETAHYVIETGRPSVSTLVSMVMMQLEMAHSAAVSAPASPSADQPSRTSH